ncbi:MAG TPA: hypothetical protein VFA65_03605 [Bryobacteraceae bacterium]|nr:hypothetical protein [Bryobacteraceae bacterium]
MALQSRLFRNDHKLEAAAVSDPAHIVPNARGLHVGKIQIALIHVDGAVINGRELQSAAYGASTARAVFAFKQKRNIINRSYQTKPDNIVGKMTIAELDREILALEPLSGRTQIQPLGRAQNLSISSGARVSASPFVAFKIGADQGFQGGPQIIVPKGASISPFLLTLIAGQPQNFNVINGKGGVVGCMDNDIAIVSDPSEPLAHGGTMSVSRDRQVFSIAGRATGTTAIVATDKSRTGFGDMLTVSVQAAPQLVTIAFHFLGGPPEVASNRNKNSVAAAVATMNNIYQGQASITFQIAGIDSSPLVIPELQNRALHLLQRELSSDWKAVTKRRSANAHLNVFFAGKIFVEDVFPLRGRPIALSSNPRTRQFVSRDTIIQDDLRGVELGVLLAHEAGHTLGEDDNEVADDLMNGSAPGRIITRAAARRLNEQAAIL